AALTPGFRLTTFAGRVHPTAHLGAPNGHPLCRAQAAPCTHDFQSHTFVSCRGHGDYPPPARTTHFETEAAIQIYRFRYHEYWYHMAGRWHSRRKYDGRDHLHLRLIHAPLNGRDPYRHRPKQS